MAEAELRQILNKTIKRGYPDLLNSDIQVEYKKLEDALAEYGELKPEGFFIEVDDTVKSASEPIKIGILASELSHIVRDEKTTALGKLKDKFLYALSKRYKILDERNTDITTVLRGFGEELYASMKFAEEKEFPYYREDGLSLGELEVILKKN